MIVFHELEVALLTNEQVKIFLPVRMNRLNVRLQARQENNRLGRASLTSTRRLSQGSKASTTGLNWEMVASISRVVKLYLIGRGCSSLSEFSYRTCGAKFS